MISLFIASLALADPGPFNLRGRFTDLAPEGLDWGLPLDGARFSLTLDAKEMADKEYQWVFKTANGKGTVLAHLQFTGGKLRGNVRLQNEAANLAGMRFDIVGARESFNTKDEKGNPIVATRNVSIREDSPVLFGDLLERDATDSIAISSSEIAWKPETVKIEVAVQVSGFEFKRALFDDHPNSNLAFDHKGRLLLGSAKQPAIYRANLENGMLEVLASTPEVKPIPSVNPVDGTIAYSWMNGHEFRLLGSSGSDKGVISQADDVKGMEGWPSYSAYDGVGRLYLMYGSSVAQMVGDRPAFVISEASGYQFQDYTKFTVAKDGTVFVGSGANIFRFAPGGKSPRKITQGPDWRPGRLHGIAAMTFDDRTKTIWVGNDTDNEFAGRVDAFDQDGRFLFTLGRGADKPPAVNTLWPSQCPFPSSVAVSPEGNLYVANYEGSRSVMEFVPIRLAGEK